MTNSLNTPIESLEFEFPLRVKQYSYRRGSGGDGTFHGGEGLIREFELLADSQLTLLSDRHTFAPYGLNGGSSGAASQASAILPGASEQTSLSAKSSQHLPQGTTVRIETPGGGGWGAPNS
jgi:N-methylhydantoinase B